VHDFGVEGDVRAVEVATQGETDASPALWLDEAPGTSILGVEDPFRPGAWLGVKDPFRRVVWLDEVTGVYRTEWIHNGEPAGGYVSVFDGSSAATRLDSRGQRSVRYEGSPHVVAQLAASYAVTAAFAFVRGDELPRGVRVRERATTWAPERGDPFTLPTGGAFRLVRQIDPITPQTVDRAYWLGHQWDGTPPLFAALSSTSDGFLTAIVVYRGVCVMTSRAPAGDRLVGEPVTTADGTPATAAHAKARPDGQFSLRWHKAEGGIRKLGYLGSELTYAGAGKRGLAIVVGDDHVIVTGKNVDDDTIPTIAAALRMI